METETLNEEEVRQSMIASGRDYLDAVTSLLSDAGIRKERAIATVSEETKLTITLHECKVTWLERLAAMVRVNAARRMDGNDVQLVFADTDGDAVLDEETGEPIAVFDSFEDISRMVISVPKSED